MAIRSIRTCGVVALVALLVATAGCTGALDAGADSPDDGPEPTPEPTRTPAEDEPSEDDGDGDADADQPAMTGRLLVSVEGDEPDPTNATTDAEADFRTNESDRHTWHASDEPITLADALAGLGVEAEAGALTYDGTTYEDGDDGSSVVYRVDGTPLDDPDAYELEDGDEVFVIVHTADVEVPGEYLREEDPHPHGTLEVTVDGEPVDFTREENLDADRYFHFHEGSEGQRWHGHSAHVTIEYALSTFPGMELTGDEFTYNGTTYDLDDGNAAVEIEVNGEPVDPTMYVLADGDDVRVTVEGED